MRTLFLGWGILFFGCFICLFIFSLSDKVKLEAISLLDVIQGDFADILNEYVEKQLYGESCD